ncbi:MAG: hypothetical protein WDN28_24985 [Chthoniobacter sp.]
MVFRTHPGPRYLRAGWKSAVPCGAVLVRGGGELSVLREGAEYPGKLEDDAQWIPATRIALGAIGRKEVGPEDFAVWILPPGTKTRALRFTPHAEDHRQGIRRLAGRCLGAAGACREYRAAGRWQRRVRIRRRRRG